MSVVGLAGMTCSPTPYSISDASYWQATLKKVSPGKNMTTKSGAGWNWVQYALALSFVM